MMNWVQPFSSAFEPTEKRNKANKIANPIKLNNFKFGISKKKKIQNYLFKHITCLNSKGFY